MAAPGQTICGDTYGLLTSANLNTAMSNGSLNIGLIDLTRVSTNDDTLLGSFANYPLNSLIRSWGGSLGPSIGSCIVYEQVDGADLVLQDPIVPGLAHLNTGSALKITSSTGSVTVDAASTGAYGNDALERHESAKPYISPWYLYSFERQRGKPSSGIQLVRYASVSDQLRKLSDDGKSGIEFDGDLDQQLGVHASERIFGYSAVVLSAGQNSYTEFVCAAPATATQFTIPAAILSLLPTNGYGALGVPGVGFQVSGVIDNRFTLAGTPGLDAAQFSAFTSTGPVVKVQ